MGVDCSPGQMRQTFTPKRAFAIDRMNRKFAASLRRGCSSHLPGAGLRSFTPLRAVVVALAIFAVGYAEAADGSSAHTQPAIASNIVIGFVGGFVAHDNEHHGPVRMAGRIRRVSPQNTYVGVFENRRRKQAYEAILKLLDTNRDGVLSAEEKAKAHIVLFGHSWGAAAAVLLARDLNRQGIPVMLTAQVDSVAKIWQNDSLIPGNVAAAVNFYQPHGFLHGRREIKAVDPAHTQILGNYKMDYREHPIDCQDASWADRFFTAGHVQSECDPSVWTQIEAMVRERLTPTKAVSTDSASAIVSQAE